MGIRDGTKTIGQPMSRLATERARTTPGTASGMTMGIVMGITTQITRADTRGVIKERLIKSRHHREDLTLHETNDQISSHS